MGRHCSRVGATINHQRANRTSSRRHHSHLPRGRHTSRSTSAGVYVLVGPDPEGHRTDRVYIGEADDIRSRLEAHQKAKDFWTHGYVLTTRDDSLHKAHVR